MNRKILLLGGGGHCKSVLDSLKDLNYYSDIGIIDTYENIGKKIMCHEIIGTDIDLLDLYNLGYKEAFVTVGNGKIRENLFGKLIDIGYDIPNIIDKSAIVSKSAILAKGIFIGKKAVVNADSHIKEGSIINTAAIVEHECIVNRFSHIAPGAILCGNVIIGENSHIGAGATIKQQISIGRDTIIGMGSVVLKNINEYCIAYGNPCIEKI